MNDLWQRYQKHFCPIPSVGFSLDISRMDFSDTFFLEMEPRIQKAYAAMAELEKGALANPDEKRMVGHYWLRAPEFAPSPNLRKEIEETIAKILTFAESIHSGKIVAERGSKFTDLLVIGIGGSALGPQFVSHALGLTSMDKLRTVFFDNTDPDGMDQVIAALGGRLASTLAVVISKSGGTKETRNGQLEAKAAYKRLGLDFARHAVAVTGSGSELSRTAKAEKWIAEFPMWDWVGGRTSELSAVGLLPAALQGIDIQAMLDGARAMDATTRVPQTATNPAALLSLMWFHATNGRGSKDMVILPYKDRLLLFSRYLQQLVMESLGKEFDLQGRVVNQGISVYGNKGSTDQHAYVQQLREGIPNFFITFLEVLKDREGSSPEMEAGVTSGDFLIGFLHGTRQALFEKDRFSITLTLPDISPRSIGALIALYERAVGFYATLIGINAYHQPGVEAGKKAANAVLQLQLKLVAEMEKQKNIEKTAEAWAEAAGCPHQAEMAFHILRHLAANPSRGIESKGQRPQDIRFQKS